jgi:hypothetical protein
MDKRDIVERTFAFAVRVVKLCAACERSATSWALIGQL